jgi:hypothetical protein
MRRFPPLFIVLLVLLIRAAVGQSPNGTISGLVLDPSGKSLGGADILIVNDATGVKYPGVTNGEGIYDVPNLPPGPYRIQVSKIGFKTLIKPDIVLNVQGAAAVNFTLPIGAVSETVTVEGGASLVKTESAAVSTVVDRQFAENLPMNGRSFQTLIELTPGVVATATNPADSGQFSVNGQRASSNYWMVDGVSANIGMTSSGSYGGTFGGTVGSFSVLGGTNSLVSVDALQEFRIQTSSYAPEFGRTPGAQISIVTRSGSNQFHGSLFDYLRNDRFDANNWFNGYTNSPVLNKAKERQNDFGGTISGPIIKNRTFFFISYEGFRLLLPQTTLTTVPDLAARQNALPADQPYLNMFPLANGSDNAVTGIAQFNASYSNPATLDAYSLRIDHRVNDKLTLFGRYNDSPSKVIQRGAAGASLSNPSQSRIATQTATIGATFLITHTASDDLRFNFSRTDSDSSSYMDGFGGAVPLPSLPFPSSFTSQDAQFVFTIFSLTGSQIVGRGQANAQRQMNLVNNLSLQRGTHSLKFGIDFRRLSPTAGPPLYLQEAGFLDVPSAETGSLYFSYIQSTRNAPLLFHNLGVFAQDTWRLRPTLTLAYGIRWDLDFAPTTARGPELPALTGYNLNDLSTLAVAPNGTPVFRTPFGSVAPRLGVAWQLSQNQRWQSVLRGGIGVFYDLASPEAADIYLAAVNYPFGAQAFTLGGTFPLGPATAAAPPIILPAPGTGSLLGFDPNLKLPDTLEWNLALEQSMGREQSLSVSYVGSVGRRLLQSAYINSPNANYAAADLVANTASSNYNALQVQFQRRLSHSLQALASYTWSHSIDTGSAESFYNRSNSLVPSLNRNINRGPSDFDIRNAFSAGVTYDMPAPKSKSFASAILRGWSSQNFIIARSATPVEVYDATVGLAYETLFSASTLVRPDLVPGTPIYLRGPQYPGGKAFNPGAFTLPPIDAQANPVRQGTLGRNALRGFGAEQWDLAIHRDFSIHDLVKLQFRGEMFNILNHPNFGPPDGNLGNSTFGRSIQTLGNSLGGGNVGGGGLSSLYQIGGPRSIQFAAKILF